MMSALSDDLRKLGYEPTDRESPFDEDGRLWSNGSELVCDETAIVVDGDHRGGDGERDQRDRFRYPNSRRVRMIGGFFSVYFDDRD